MKRTLSLGLIALFLLTGCSSIEPSGSTPIPKSSKAANAWVRACANYEYSASKDFEIAYEEVIRDACAKVDLNAIAVPFESSQTVNKESLEIYIGAEKFHLGYWNKYMQSGFPTKQRIVFTELDQAWWEQKMNENILKPDLSWFTSKNEGGHCRVESDIFCPKFFEPVLTTTGLPTEFRIIGTKLGWQDWQLLNSAHETVHLYQDSHGMSHWAFWYIEGQATFFELAMSKLYFGDNYLRREFIVTRPNRQDSLKYSATNLAESRAFLKKCKASRNGDCENFKYGAGSLFHEKLVIDYGLAKYFDWQMKLAARMPKGNPGNLSHTKQMRTETEFAVIFEESFGQSLDHFENQTMAQYLLDYAIG